MKSRLKFFFRYFAFWLALFILGKIAFLFYQHSQSFHLPFTDWFRIIGHGFLLDLSATGYFVLLPLVVLIGTSFSNYKLPGWLIGGYTGIALFLFIIITLVDFEIYKYWGVRLDSTALRFVDKPREMLASTSWSMVMLLLISLIAFMSLFFYLYRRYVAVLLANSQKPRWVGLLFFVLLLPFVFLAIRGSFGIAPISVSRVYFHPEPFPNYAANNVVWNLGHSLLEKKDQPNPFKYLDDQTARRYLDELFAEDSTRIELLNNRRPNVILIIMESFTAKLVEPLGGLPGVTPNFNQLCRESVLFTNFFANDSRTDKSIVSILSGYPALGKISIIKFPNKTQKLGIISRELAQAGYQTSFLYGGDVDFANIRSYLVNGSFQNIVEVSDFNKSQQTGRWGVHDSYTFQRLYDDCNASDTPFFKVFLTLSNHEPFDLPVRPRFGNKTIDDKVSSSAYYTDSCMGDFIQKARLTNWWNNSLIIMLADHGIKYPGNTIVYYPEKYRIPMIWTGGAIKSDTLITTYSSQSDLARTLLNQLNMDASAYPLSKDIFRAKHQFAFYEFNNGFGMMSDTAKYVYDNDLQKVILNQGGISDFFLQCGMAVQQEVYDVFLKN
ncbi:MAG: sulfatase-like hydrolase/transferase [Bacteroidales bacterium]|nr:sulfatase-like hydrolase/transferase [Bacteroidales bacterium]